jgi:hypothetical protein
MLRKTAVDVAANSCPSIKASCQSKREQRLMLQRTAVDAEAETCKSKRGQLPIKERPCCDEQLSMQESTASRHQRTSVYE